VPEHFFEVTAGDVRSAAASAAKNNMMMTKTMREAAKPKYKVLTMSLYISASLWGGYDQ